MKVVPIAGWQDPKKRLIKEVRWHHTQKKEEPKPIFHGKLGGGDKMDPRNLRSLPTMNSSDNTRSSQNVHTYLITRNS